MASAKSLERILDWESEDHVTNVDYLPDYDLPTCLTLHEKNTTYDKSWREYKDKLNQLLTSFVTFERDKYCLKDLANLILHMAIHGFRVNKLPTVKYGDKVVNGKECFQHFGIFCSLEWTPSNIFRQPAQLTIPDVFAYFCETIQSVLYTGMILSSFYKKYCHKFNTDYFYEPACFFPYSEFLLINNKYIQLQLQGILQLQEKYPKSKMYETSISILHFRKVEFHELGSVVLELIDLTECVEL